MHCCAALISAFKVCSFCCERSITKHLRITCTLEALDAVKVLPSPFGATSVILLLYHYCVTRQVYAWSSTLINFHGFALLIACCLCCFQIIQIGLKAQVLAELWHLLCSCMQLASSGLYYCCSSLNGVACSRTTEFERFRSNGSLWGDAFATSLSPPYLPILSSLHDAVAKCHPCICCSVLLRQF